jgi:hypothetical protein
MTISWDSSSNGMSSAEASTKVSLPTGSGVRAFAMAFSLTSIPVTEAPRSAMMRATLPSPQPMSATRLPSKSRASSIASRGCFMRIPALSYYRLPLWGLAAGLSSR